MALVINTNVASLNAQRNLNKSQDSLAVSLQRLSSGMRINSAKDDAAGLAISERFTAQIRGLNQGVRNANDGISLAQTAEGALGEVTNNLQRIRELAVQSANATNSSSDRLAMQQEVEQLANEIDRVASQTNFNGVNLLDGSFTNQNFQVGSEVGDTIAIASLVDATKAGLGLYNGSATAAAEFPFSIGSLAAGDVTINGVDLGAHTDPDDVVSAIEAISDDISVDHSFSWSGSWIDSVGGDGTSSYQLDVAGVNIFTGTGPVTAAAMDAALNGGTVLADLASAGVTVTGSFSGAQISFTSADGTEFSISEAWGGTAYATIPEIDYEGTHHMEITNSTGDLVIGGNDPSGLGLTAETIASSGNTFDVTSAANANSLITAVDSALGTVNSARANLGAIQNRFESVVTSLQTSSESVEAARSRILDTDFAIETANLTRSQILQQAGSAMLAQANSLPQNVMSLLQ